MSEPEPPEPPESGEPQGTDRLGPWQKRFITVGVLAAVAFAELTFAMMLMALCRWGIGKEWLHGERFYLVFVSFSILRLTRPYAPSERPTMDKRLCGAIVRATCILIATAIINWQWP